MRTKPSLSSGKPDIVFALSLMFCGAVLAVGGMLTGLSLNSDSVSVDKQADARAELDEIIKLHADSAAKGKTLSLATGLVDDSIEGLFVLDHLTGNLQCWLINTRTGTIGGIFRANVATDMSMEKLGEADYAMVTGGANFQGGRAGNERAGNCICYVADSNSGAVVCYGVQYSPQMLKQGEMQESEMVVVSVGLARGEQVERDQ